MICRGHLGIDAVLSREGLMQSLRIWEFTRPCLTQNGLWRIGWFVRSMAISPWGDDSREVKRWGFTGSQWKKLHRRLRLHGVRLPKRWILDPNKNYNMLGNINQMKQYNMTDQQQRMALLEGVFLFTKVSCDKLMWMRFFNKGLVDASWIKTRGIWHLLLKAIMKTPGL